MPLTKDSAYFYFELVFIFIIYISELLKAEYLQCFCMVVKKKMLEKNDFIANPQQHVSRV